MFQRRFGGGKKLDRGRRTHGAKWVFVRLDEHDFVDYAPLRAQYPDEKAWAAWRKARPTYVLVKSRREAKRFLALLEAERRGGIRALRYQVDIPLYVKSPEGLNVKIGVYRADFTYEELGLTEDPAVDAWTGVIEDCKGYEEDLFKWKRKHLEAQLGVSLRIS